MLVDSMKRAHQQGEDLMIGRERLPELWGMFERLQGGKAGEPEELCFSFEIGANGECRHCKKATRLVRAKTNKEVNVLRARLAEIDRAVKLSEAILTPCTDMEDLTHREDTILTEAWEVIRGKSASNGKAGEPDDQGGTR